MCDAGINELKAIIRELKLQNPHDKRLFDLRYLKNKSINRKFYSAKTFK